VLWVAFDLIKEDRLGGSLADVNLSHTVVVVAMMMMMMMIIVS
jgi:uncharacterized membrane protein